VSKSVNIHPAFRKHAAFIQGYLERMFGFPVGTNEALMYAIHVTHRAKPKNLPEIPTNPHIRGVVKYDTWSSTLSQESYDKLNYLAGIFQYEVPQMAAACLIATSMSIKQVDTLMRPVKATLPQSLLDDTSSAR